MGYYDQMQVCENGHQITASARSAPQFKTKFCASCGAATIDSCPSCNTPIRGSYETDGVIFIGSSPPVPSYCHDCGAAYPWRQAALENLSEILRESELSEQEISAIEATFPDVLRDTPKTESAALKLRRLLGSLKKPAYDMTIKVISDLASETAKKTMGLS
jgi:hypothetical protein